MFFFRSNTLAFGPEHLEKGINKERLGYKAVYPVFWKMYLIKPAILLLLILASPCWGFCAGETEFVSAFGEATVSEHEPLSSAKISALNNARRNAIEKAVGIDIYSESISKDFTLLSDFIASLSSGHIIEEIVEKWEVVTAQSGVQNFPAIKLRVSIKAKVHTERGRGDSSYRVFSSINRNIFTPGDDVVVKITPTKDSYITLFIITEGNRAYLIYPTRYTRLVKVKANETFVYPSPEDIKAGHSLKAGLFPGENESKEYLKIIATRDPLALDPNIFVEGVGLDAFKEDTGLVPLLIKELIRIPPEDRAEAMLTYEIFR